MLGAMGKIIQRLRKIPWWIPLVASGGSGLILAFFPNVVSKRMSTEISLLGVVLLLIAAGGLIKHLCLSDNEEATISEKPTDMEIKDAPIEDAFVPIYQVVDYVRTAIGDDNEGQCYPDTLIALRQAALNGEIRIVGKAELQHKSGHPDNVETDVKREYWNDHELAELATSPAYTTSDHSRPLKYRGPFGDRRWALRVSKNDVMGKWPNGTEAAFADDMPLREACRIAYEHTQGTLAAKAAEKEGGKDAVLNWYANMMIKVFGISLFGARPPSTNILLIENLGSTHFADGAKRLVDNHNEQIEYVHLSIRPNDLTEAIQRIRELNNPI